jgi:hypothetical protein
MSLTREESRACYAIIRHNVRTYESAGVVEVIKGKQNAESTVKQFEDGQASEDRHAGWRYFLEKTEIKPGTSPAEATHLRQEELELREAKVMQEEPVPAPFPHRHN